MSIIILSDEFEPRSVSNVRQVAACYSRRMERLGTISIKRACSLLHHPCHQVAIRLGCDIELSVALDSCSLVHGFFLIHNIFFLAMLAAQRL